MNDKNNKYMNNLLENLKKYLDEVGIEQAREDFEAIPEFGGLRVEDYLGYQRNGIWSILGKLGFFKKSELILSIKTWEKEFRERVDLSCLDNYIPFPNCDEILNVLPKIFCTEDSEYNHEICIEHSSEGYYVSYDFINEYVVGETLRDALGNMIILLIREGYEKELKYE